MNAGIHTGPVRLLTGPELEELLRAAQEALAAHLRGQKRRADVANPALLEPGMAFVTLKKAGELRGCIGNLQASQPLVRVVEECAVAAASRDPRFPPVVPDELPELTVSVSVLGDFKTIQSPAEIEIGRHGLFISKRGQRGILLPQVASEMNLNPQEFLQLVCKKALLPEDAWREKALIYTFTSQAFPPSQR